MSTSHDESHALLLAEIAAGERRADEPASAALLAGCAECRAALAALRETAQQVECAGERMRTGLAESRDLSDVPGLERVGPTLSRLAGEPPAGRRSPWRLLLLVAAVVLLVGGPLVAWRIWTRGETPAQPLMLGGDELEIVEPVGKVDDFDLFAWKYSGEASGFRLRIWDDAADENADSVLDLRCEQSSWVPTPDERAALPDTIRWEVEPIDAFGVGHGARRESAQRSPR